MADIIDNNNNTDTKKRPVSATIISDDNNNNQQDNNGSPSLKKQKMNSDSTSSTTRNGPLLYPALIPGVPPRAPKDKEKQNKKVLTIAERHGFGGPDVYCAADYFIWPEVAMKTYRAQVNIQNRNYASQYMLYWFEEHKGMMVPAKKPARSAYSLFFNEQKSILAKKNGKWNNKKDGKKVGGMWKVLDDAGKQKYFDDYELRQDTYGKQVEHWEKETRKWREEKRCRLISEGIEVDNQKRMTLQLNPICECDLCCFDKDA